MAVAKLDSTSECPEAKSGAVLRVLQALKVCQFTLAFTLVCIQYRLTKTFAGQAKSASRPAGKDDSRYLPAYRPTGQAESGRGPLSGQKRSLQWTRESLQQPGERSRLGPAAHKWQRTVAPATAHNSGQPHPLTSQAPSAPVSLQRAHDPACETSQCSAAAPAAGPEPTSKLDSHMQPVCEQPEPRPLANNTAEAPNSHSRTAAKQPGPARQRMTRLGRNKLVRQASRAAASPRILSKRRSLTAVPRTSLQLASAPSRVQVQQPRLVRRGLHRLVLSTPAAQAAKIQMLASPRISQLVRQGRFKLAAAAQSPLLRRLSLPRGAAAPQSSLMRRLSMSRAPGAKFCSHPLLWHHLPPPV